MTAPIIPPGSTLGVLGGGQLGRMFAIAARRLGYRVHTLDPASDTPTAHVADRAVIAPYEDVARVREFAGGVDVVTFEFENVPAQAAAAAAEVTLVRPNGGALAVAQHRLREKDFLSGRGLPVAPYGPVRSEADLLAACARVGMPAVLKTAALGYDGKGQVALRSGDDPRAAWAALGHAEAILEAFIDLQREVSVIGARGVDGATAFYPVFDNTHRNHILDVTVAPADIPGALARQAVEVTRDVLEGLDYVGILCIEFFITRDGRLLVNELAPRPHNSGHLTFDACVTSQFEQQVRAVCGLPLGATDLLKPAAMVNLLGDVWQYGEPDWAAALAMPDVKLHLYGKASPRPGRKMGHLTVMASTTADARARALDARARLARA